MKTLKAKNQTGTISNTVCEVCNENPANLDKHNHMLICDNCNYDFECATEANDGWGEAFSEFAAAHPDKVIMECMNCSEWVPVDTGTEDNSCTRCGGGLLGEDD